MTDACNQLKNTQKDAVKIVYLPNTVWLSKSSPITNGTVKMWLKLTLAMLI